MRRPTSRSARYRPSDSAALSDHATSTDRPICDLPHHPSHVARQLQGGSVSLDESVDGRLSRFIIGHDAKTARQMGWSAISNGQLLALAAKDFDVLVPADQNLAFQQNLAAFNIAVIVLRARSNRLRTLQSLVPDLLAAIPAATPGAATYVGTSP